MIQTNTADLPTIVAIGFSSRALVDACRVAGLKCLAIDHFGDADTRAHASEGWLPLHLTEGGELTSDCEQSIEHWVCSHHQDSRLIAVLAGGMENLPAVLQQLRRWMPVAGPDPEQMMALRDHSQWRQAAADAGLAFPELFESYREWLKHPVPKQLNQWISKPMRSAGGLHIRTLGDIASEPSMQNLPDRYLQRIVPGQPLGVTCLLDVRRSQVLGATKSLTAEHWPAPSPFIYRGSIGPVRLADASIDAIERLSDWYRNRWNVRGWLQFDFIEDDRGQLWLLECNPRWTAGMEILVHAQQPNLVLQHLAASGYLETTKSNGNPSWQRMPKQSSMLLDRDGLYHQPKSRCWGEPDGRQSPMYHSAVSGLKPVTPSPQSGQAWLATTKPTTRRALVN